MVKLGRYTKTIAFWLAYSLLLFGVGYGCYKILASEVYAYMLWQKLIEDPDHRWKPMERKDINSDGLRSSRSADDFKPEDFNIIFAGDSFTFGHLLAAEQSVPDQFELIARTSIKRPKINVVNFGWSSSSPYLSLRLLQDKAKKYHPDLVIFLLDITDYKDDHFYQNVIEKSGNYKFIVEHPLLAFYPRRIARYTDSYTGWQQSLLGYPDSSIYFVAHQPYDKSVPFFQRSHHNLKRMNDYVHNDLGAKFIVFIPPRHWQYTDRESPNSWEKHNYTPLGPFVLNNYIYFDQAAKTSEFPIVSLLDDFKNSSVFPTTFEKDSHWNPEGANLAANFIFQHCLKLECFSPVQTDVR